MFGRAGACGVYRSCVARRVVGAGTLTTDLVPGGPYSVEFAALGHTMSGRVVSYEPGRSLVFTWGWAHEPDGPPETVAITVTGSPRPRSTSATARRTPTAVWARPRRSASTSRRSGRVSGAAANADWSGRGARLGDGDVRGDHGGAACVHGGERLLEHAGQFRRVVHRGGVGAARRGCDARQVGLGLEGDVEVVGGPGRALRVDAEG
ncbi:hypothetical protein EAS64_33550 [Trebonia kvetii]|uniref:Activator of Hsp90 ATPase homologue 1/2-like C-terminal domain-containing protein n=1 Tax=Trebonia kvetii TaxID=2480626 RepID=A0A6P2BQS4_9ACTN|nr:hypothetical protein EAS64_33550 [Trebonia kvetii]